MIFLIGIGVFFACNSSIINSNAYNNQLGGIAGMGAIYTSEREGEKNIIVGMEIAGAGANNSGAVNNIK